NIAHGTSSLISTQLGLRLADYFVTEAGFGSDLGAEKFFNIACRTGGLKPAACVITATTRALKRQGRGNDLDALIRGLDNLDKHISNVSMFDVPPVVAINGFPGDKTEEHRAIISHCQGRGVPAAVVNVREKGGEGGLELAQMVLKAAETENDFHTIYPLDVPLKDKIKTISQMIYGAGRVVYSVQAEKDLRHIEEDLGLGHLPICMSKTPYSLSDDHDLLGRPRNFKITVSGVRVSAGAGFVVPFTGTLTTMPGLPSKPAATNIDLRDDGSVTGLF
ncbi:MAG: formate--tetrahydrofolate ligase, partial [Candidatus Thermoplasmatota archaeon]|nr:formate--tetrahydrofolate ligase [Candidatus Thermoplasmatota archaeon]